MSCSTPETATAARACEARTAAKQDRQGPTNGQDRTPSVAARRFLFEVRKRGGWSAWADAMTHCTAFRSSD